MQLKASNPRDLRSKVSEQMIMRRSPNKTFDRYVELGKREEPAKQPAFRFVHPDTKGEIPLTDSELATLAEISNPDLSSDQFRDLETLKGYPAGSWGRDQVRIIEAKLVPLGLVVAKETEHYKSVCELSDMAKRGEFIVDLD